MMFSLRNAAWAAFIASTTVTAAPPSYSGGDGSGSLPVVDLGYERHQASYYNETGAFYNFTNIRYAAPRTSRLPDFSHAQLTSPPATGENRFRAPLPPANNRGEVQTGEQGRICPQANPAWSAISAEWIPAYFAGQTSFNESSFNTTSSGQAPAVDPRTSEDCLFLDVVVPKAIFEGAGKNGKNGAPVLVWIYGGGYTAGSKDGSGSPAGLIKRSQSDSSKGVIVSLPRKIVVRERRS